jgi:predicted Zn-dependent peptidase
MRNTILSLLLLTALTASAQDSGIKGVIRLNKIPVSNEILRVTFPRPAISKLSNGLEVMILEDHRVPTFSVQLVIPASGLDEPAELSGVSDATASMMNLGTKTRTALQITESLGELGGSLNISSGSSNTTISVGGLTDNIDELLNLMGDVLMNPTFPQDEFDKWKRRQLNSLQQARTAPGYYTNLRLYPILYPGDARAITSITEASIGKLTRQHLIDYYQSHYGPAGSYIAITGDVKLKEMTVKLEKVLAPWKGGSAKRPELPIRAPIADKKVILIDRPNSVQTTITVANRAISRTDPDYYAFTLLNRILGQGSASRLYRNVREDKGYTYGINSGLAATRYSNHFIASTSVRTEVTGAALTEILKEFKDIRENLIPAEELEAAKRAIVASFALSLQSTSTMLTSAMTLKEYGFPADYWDRYPEMIMKVTPQQIRDVARKYIPLDNVQIIAVGDGAKVRDQLRPFGAVEEQAADNLK